MTKEEAGMSPRAEELLRRSAETGRKIQLIAQQQAQFRADTQRALAEREERWRQEEERWKQEEDRQAQTRAGIQALLRKVLEREKRRKEPGDADA